MSSNFNNAKVINVYYNKGDRKPYDVNGKPIAYIGEEAIGATEATTIRFYLGEDLDSSTAVIVTKRPDGERRLDLCEKFGTGVNSYYQVTLNAWYGAVKGKATLAFKVYNGSVVFDDNETPTEIISVNGRIVVSDIFNLEIAYAPEADLIVPADDTPDYVEWFAALSTKLDKAQSITVTGALPTLTGDVYDDRYFYVENEGVGKLFYIDGSTAIEVVFQIGTLKLTSNGNEDINVGTNAGKMYWDEDRGTIIAGLYDDQEAGVGDSLFFFGKATEAIAKGEVVQFAGNTGGNIRIKKAVFAEISAQPDLLMGVAKHAIASGDFGYVASFGYVRNLNTSAFTTPILYLSTTTPGALSSTKPTTGFKGSIAAVARPSTGGGSDGFLIVRPNLVKGIGELADVTITTATSGQILSFDGSKWVNSTRLTTAESNITNLQGRMTAEEANVDNLQGRMTSAEGDIDDIESGATIVPRALGDQNGNTINTTYLTQSSASATYIPLSQKAQANGVATLGADGRVIPSQIPGIVSSVEEYDSLEDFPEVGVLTTVYLALDTGLTYLWSGSGYVALSSSLALGETSTTAYRGDRGKIAYDYSQVGHLPLAGGTVTGNLVVGGDLTISGTTTTIDTETVGIKDNIILINSNQTGTPSTALKGGLEIERGDLTNFQFVFDESDDRFKVGQVGSLQTVATRTDDGTIADRGITYFNTSTNRLENNAEIIIDSIGEVGIGTNNPSQKVEINGDTGQPATTGAIQNGLLRLRPRTGVTGYGETLDIGYHVGVTGPASYAWLQSTNVGALGVLNNLVLNPNGGNVGIGIASPTYKLDVTGNLRTTGGIDNESSVAGNSHIGLDGGSGVFSNILTTTSTGNTIFRTFIAPSDYVERMRITGAGNVGIGTTSPGSRLEVSRSDDASVNIATFKNTTLNQSLVIASPKGTHDFLWGAVSGDTAIRSDSKLVLGASGDVLFSSPSATNVTIKSSGNVGIGTTNPSILGFGREFSVSANGLGTPSSYINVQGSRTDDNDVGGLVFHNIVSGTNAVVSSIGSQRSGANNSGNLIFYTSNAGTNTERMRIASNGNVTITGTIVQEAFIAPTLLNSWVNFGSGYQEVGYMKDSMGFVHIRGMIKSGTLGATVFTLPAGYRPNLHILQVGLRDVSGTEDAASFQILNDGSVQVITGSTSWTSFGNISFKAG